MAEVYANSYLTVAASSSSDSSSGYFPSWDIRSTYPLVSSETISLGVDAGPDPAPMLDTREGSSKNSVMRSRMPFAFILTIHFNASIYIHPEWLPSSTKYNGKSVGIERFGKWFDPVANEPLNTRGWTLQERLLPPRILYCGSEQIFWQCYLDFLAEEGSKFHNKFTNLDTVIRGQQLPVTKRGRRG